MATNESESHNLIGRTSQVHSVATALDAVEAGQPRVLMLAGEAGIGKSSVAHAAERMADSRGWQILRGACYEEDGRVPFAPVVDFLRADLAPRGAGAVATRLGRHGAEIGRLLPEYATSETKDDDSDTGRHRLHSSLAGYLSAAASEQPVLLVVDDLHWCDDATLGFLLHLGRRAAGCRLGIVLCYRTDEVNAGLRHLLAELERLPITKTLKLHPLNRAEVRELAGRQGRELAPELVDRVYSLTEGNPFFVEEVVSGLSDSTSAEVDVEVSGSIADSVDRRFSALPADAQRLADVGAVVGRRFELETARILSGVAEHRLPVAVRALVEAGLVVEVDADALEFRHALTREALRGHLLAIERRSINRRVMALLEGRQGAHVEQLAYHAFEGAEWDRAVRYCRDAAARSLALFAPRATVEHATNALRASDTLGHSPDPSLLLLRGTAHDHLGAFEAALADLEGAVAAATREGQTEVRLAAMLQVGMLWAARDYSRAEAPLTAALETARELGSPAMVARCLNRLGNWHANHNLPNTALSHHREALSLADELDEPALLAETWDLLGVAYDIAGEMADSAEAGRKAIELFAAMGDRHGELHAQVNLADSAPGQLSDALVSPLTLEEGIAVGEPALAAIRELDWPAGEAYALWQVAALRAVAGQLDEALGEFDDALQISLEIGHRQWAAATLTCCALTHCDLLDFRGGMALAAQALTEANAVKSEFWIGAARSVEAQAWVALGEFDRARALIADIEPGAGPERTAVNRRAMLTTAELELAEGNGAAAIETIDRLTGPHAHKMPWAARLRGAALLCEGRLDDARAAFGDAIAAAERLGVRSMRWRAHIGTGRVADARGDHEAAAASYHTALGEAEDFVLGLSDGPLRAGFLEGVRARIPRTRGAAVPAQFGGLTPREREVAWFVARGKSNREIADELVLSVRTVETHVTNVLNKLGFNARTQIAAWSAETGLRRPGT